MLNEHREALLRRLALAEGILRTTFRELETLDYRPTYDRCIEIIKRVLKG